MDRRRYCRDFFALLEFLGGGWAKGKVWPWGLEGVSIVEIEGECRV